MIGFDDERLATMMMLQGAFGRSVASRLIKYQTTSLSLLEVEFISEGCHNMLRFGRSVYSLFF